MLWLLLVSVFTFACISAYAHPRHGAMGLAAAALAGLVCLVSACAALLVTSWSTSTPNAATGILLGIFLRTVIPFFVSILLVQGFKPLADAGLFGMVLINYFVVLAVETVLVVRIVQAQSSTLVRQ